MMSLKECRKVLGAKYASLTDEQIIEIRDFLYLLSEIQFKHIMKEANENMNGPSQTSK